MIKRHNNASLAIGVPGLILQIVGRFKEQPGIVAVGTVLLIIGLVFYAKAKGRHPAWGLMGLLSLLGLIILACLKDLVPEEGK